MRVPLAVVATAALSACATATASEPIRIPVTMTEFAYSEALIEAPAGRPVTIKLTNAGLIDHDLVIDEADVRVRLRPGQGGAATIRPLSAGTYVIYCSIPTHRELGMIATLVVR